MPSAVMSRSCSTEPGRWSRRRAGSLLLALLAPGALAACGKKGTLRLPGPEDELDQDDELDEGDVLQDDELGGEDVPNEDPE
jgi:predicted small lipoprotein YifL